MGEKLRERPNDFGGANESLAACNSATDTARNPAPTSKHHVPIHFVRTHRCRGALDRPRCDPITNEKRGCDRSFLSRTRFAAKGRVAKQSFSG